MDQVQFILAEKEWEHKGSSSSTFEFWDAWLEPEVGTL